MPPQQENPCRGWFLLKVRQSLTFLGLIQKLVLHRSCPVLLKDLDLWDKNKECSNRESKCLPCLMNRLWRMCVGICSNLDLLIRENTILQLCWNLSCKILKVAVDLLKIMKKDRKLWLRINFIQTRENTPCSENWKSCVLWCQNNIGAWHLDIFSFFFFFSSLTLSAFKVTICRSGYLKIFCPGGYLLH